MNNTKNNNLTYNADMILASFVKNPHEAAITFKNLNGGSDFGFGNGESILNDKSVKPYYELIKIICEHLDPYYYPFVKGDKRDEMLTKRLQKFYIKYVEVI